MKNALLFVIIIFASSMAQAQENNDAYTNLWNQVEKHEKQALAKTPLAVVKTIAEKARKEGNSAQFIKALLYQSKYAMTLEEDAQLKIINSFKSEITKAEFPTKNILESYLANLYWQYFQNNRYQFYNRTKTETKIDSVDFRTWDLTTLFNEINIHFNASLTNTKELSNCSTQSFESILRKQKNSEVYRPTLLDLLAHTALQFYKTNENNITRPANKFEIDDPNILCEALPFTQQKIDLSDASSMQAKTLVIYQQLLDFHLNNKSSEAFVTIDIERLKFIYDNAVFENKDEQYLKVLNNTIAGLKQNKNLALYQYEIAAHFQQLGQSYNPTSNTENRWKLKEALALCNTVIKNYAKSEGAEKCRALKSRIIAQSLSIRNENQLPTNAASRLLVSYTNHHQLQLSARKISQSQLTQLEKIWKKPKKLAFIKQLPTVKKWQSDLKNETDYQKHSTEIILPALPNNQYIILAEPTENTNSTFAFSTVQVTNFALVETRTATHHNFQVINRNDGAPISGAKIKLDYNINYNGTRKSTTHTTDKMGMVSLPLTEQNWYNVSIHIKHADEVAFYNDFYVNSKYPLNKFTGDHTAFIFTDRSIYRPGQALFFKGIALKREIGKSSVVENTIVDVILRDVNHQELKSQQYKTNEFGSFSGEFILPANGLTGNFTIEVVAKKPSFSSLANFSIEEYKRPKFETTFKPITETYKVNDSIKVIGIAQAFAGSTITDATVGYRVKRVISYPRWYYWHRPYFNTTPQEIAHGETKTDDAGNYEINFKALPDSKTNAENRPTFRYEITADVTDINGETQSATTIVQVGYHSLTATITVPNELDKNLSNAKIEISTNNLNGQFVPAKGSIKMYKLMSPEQVLRQRPWAAPDYSGFTKAEFKKQFPHEAFANENDFTQWKKGALVWQSSFNTANATELELQNISQFRSGKYVFELETADKFGQAVKDIVHTTLFSNTEKKLADNQLFQIKTDMASYKIGDQAEVSLLSNAKDLAVTLFIEKDQQIIETKVIQLRTNAKSFKIPVHQTDLGGFVVNYSYSAYNAFVSGSLAIAVPYPQKQLEIETLTFRDKLKPGTDETWSFKIKGAKGEKVAAELLASMYDASLDTFKDHNWSFSPLYQPQYYTRSFTNARQSFGSNSFQVYTDSNGFYYHTQPNFDTFNWFGFYFGNGGVQKMYREGSSARLNKSAYAPEAEMMLEDVVLEEATVSDTIGDRVAGVSLHESKNLEATINQAPVPPPSETKNDASDEVQIRKNLQETAFFFPQLHTDKEGNVSFSFTSPEALTKWNLQLLAHTKDLQSTYQTKQTITQKELMILPNAPRFLREGDAIVISAKIANLADKDLSGYARLELIDAVTGKDVSLKLLSAAKTLDQKFQVDALNNTHVSWRLNIPKNIQAVQYKVIAKAGDFSDGEQNLLPVLSNRMLVTETLPMWVRSKQSKTFSLDKLAKNTSTTASNHKLTLEITSNPAWYAVQALPYLMEYPHECNEQMFARYYANTLASFIANSNPRIQEVFKQWRNSDALLSNLEKNEELKSILIQETPWLRDAQSESEQKKRIALLFNLDKLKNEQGTALLKLKNNQNSSGAWPWFKGGRDNRYITQHISTGLGHLKQLSTTNFTSDTQQILAKAMRYLDAEFVKEYKQMKRYAKNVNDNHLSNSQIQYLYMRSFFPELKTSKEINQITAYYMGQAKQYWMHSKLYTKGMLALVLHRANDTNTANTILESLKDNSINSIELGMYWKENTASWNWYQAPIETQALLIEAFSEIENDIKTVDNLKIWLLKNKQTNQWKTTKATTEAVYALLLRGTDWLAVNENVSVLVGGEKIATSKLEQVKLEAGTGYFKTSWSGAEITPKMAQVQLDKKDEGIAWGALYWQYFEDLDKITSAKTPLQLKKKLFLKKNTANGEVISEVTEKTVLKVGDLVRVRIELRSDRDMEFIHMKDMRAAGFEPVNVLSKYKWQDGLGYYESTKDASTNFFIDFLPKGVFVFEYDLRVNNAGQFSNGITSIQSMYAPEFTSHSNGSRVSVD